MEQIFHDHHSIDLNKSANEDIDIEFNVTNQAYEEFVVIEADESELLHKEVKNEQEAYDLYNDYAFLKGFSIRRNKQRKRSDGCGISMKQYCCSKEGNKKSDAKCYTKQDIRTDCKAMICCYVDEKGTYIVTKHHMIHNHKLCPENKHHLLRSHRNVSKEDIDWLMNLVGSGIKLSDAVRLITKEKGGLEMVGYTPRDAYNVISREKKKCIEGTDAHAVIQIFMRRQQHEEDFFFDFELDEEGRLCNFFWRDGQMKKDYDLFSDPTITDTTYRTNRYDMICAPFVGMNHHGRNIMFGCGFVLNERTESFIWLFKMFLKSMGDKKPSTIMTDQSAAMAGGIKEVFKKSCHRLCVCHLMENTKKHIIHLRARKGFVELFDQVLKYVDSVAEFNLMVTTYQCGDNDWLLKLYKKKEQWCPAYSKEHFSGGILSSQRNETTNDSISRRLTATAGLCDFYSCFVDVISEWRRRENGEDFDRLQGNPEMIANHINILTHAREVYTIELYHVFEEQFLKSWTLHQDLFEKNDDIFIYHVGRATNDQIAGSIKHVVIFNQKEKSIYCTCRMYSQVGILCSHNLRIMNLHCLGDIPKQYILKTWTKEAISTTSSNMHSHLPRKDNISTYVWRTQMTRKFNELISASHCNVVSIQNPVKSRKPGQKNKRRKSTVEKINNIVRGRKAKSFRVANHTRNIAEASVQSDVNNVVGDGYLVHPTNGGPLLIPIPIIDQYLRVPLMKTPTESYVQTACSIGHRFNRFTQAPNSASTSKSCTLGISVIFTLTWNIFIGTDIVGKFVQHLVK
ncbi:protein FAR1-RELATED SEQUENCE 5-like [Silene latifolia]|uniref:protein FAR1-RELATED SEQUENCE 5-like n=1 Tax=Silene latifolia TaxID=37657 RepID=UPI003D775471